MCRTGGRRCPSHSDPTMVAARNARRREQYSSRNQGYSTMVDEENPVAGMLNHASMGLYGKKSVGFTPLDEGYEPFDEYSEDWEEYKEDAKLFLRTLRGEYGKKFYDLQTSLYSYTAGDYNDVRDYLNGYRVRATSKEEMEKPFEKRTIKMVKRIISDLDGALKLTTPPASPRKVYRGMQVPVRVPAEDAAAWVAENFTPGKVVSQKSYMSTTLNPAKANFFSGTKNGVIFEILTKEGAVLGQGTSQYNEMETEVLMPREAKFKVVSVTVDAEVKLKPSKGYNSLNGVQTTKKTIIRMVDAGEENN